MENGFPRPIKKSSGKNANFQIKDFFSVAADRQLLSFFNDHGAD